MESFVSFGLDELDMNRSRVRDLFEARLLFEPQMAALACERATDAEIEDILQAGAEVERQIRSNQDRTPADQEFHKKIAIASDKKKKKKIVRNIAASTNEKNQE